MTNASTGARNERLVLLIVLLDLIGFSIVFPVVPELLDFYISGASTNRYDRWLPGLLERLLEMLPVERRSRAELIVLVGGALGSLYAFLQFIVSPIWGRLSDRIGRRPVLLLTSAGLALSYLLWAVSHSFVLFLFSRALGGLSAGNLGVASAAMADLSSPEDRTKKMGLLGAAFGLGFIIGPVIGGLSAHVDLGRFGGPLHPFSFCALFAFVISLTSVVLNGALLRETLPQEGRAHTWVANPFGGVALRRARPILLLNFLFFLGFAGFEFTMVFFYKLEFGLDPRRIGLVFLYVGVMLVIGQGLLVRRLSPRFSERQLAVAGVVLTAPGVYLFAGTSPHVWLSLVALGPVALGSALIQPALASLCSLRSDAAHQGTVLGAFRASGSLARAIGPLLGAYLYWILGVQVAYLLLALGMLLMRGGLAFVGQLPPKQTATEA